MARAYELEDNWPAAIAQCRVGRIRNPQKQPAATQSVYSRNAWAAYQAGE